MKRDSAMRYVEQWTQRQGIGYKVPDFTCNLIWRMISLYLLHFYTDVISLSVKSIVLMFAVTRFIDGGTDLLIGYCTDHTRTRWGKSRPRSLLGVVPFTLFVVLTLSTPDTPQSGKLIYAYTAYIGLSLTYTVVNIPMASTLSSLVTDAQERTALSTTRKSFVFLGSTVISSTVLRLVDSLDRGSEVPGSRIVMIISGFIGCLPFSFTFTIVKERANTVAESVSLKESLMSLGKNKPWLIFVLNITLMWIDSSLQTSTIVYYYIAVIGSKELSITIITIMSTVPVAADFLAPTLAGRTRRCNLYVGNAVIQLAGLVVILFAGIDHGVTLAGVMVTALGYGTKESIYFSMQADPVDHGEWKTGINTTGLLSATNSSLGKMVQAAAGSISGILPAWGAYQGGVLVQSSNAILAIKAMHLYTPMPLLICSIVTMLFYGLSKIYPQVKAVLDSRNG